MKESLVVAGKGAGSGMLVLAVDTCGPSGTVALARIGAAGAEVLGQRELAGRTYSATLVAAVAELLTDRGLRLGELGAIVVVNGPGSFTGVRVGVSAVKGLAEPGQIPVAAVSRLAVLAEKAGVGSAALDAHRHEVFLRVAEPDGGMRELLAGAEELGEIARRGPESQVSESRSSDKLRAGSGAPDSGELVRVAVSDEEAAALLASAWPSAELVRVEPPTAADAIRLCVPTILAGEFADLALLDGHYLRRSDAEIFGDAPKAAAKPGTEILMRRMRAEDLERVMDLAANTHHAPSWTRAAYEKALNSDSVPRRVALVAEEGQSGGLIGFAVASLIPGATGAVSEAELESVVTALPHQRRGVARGLFAALKAELRRCGVSEMILEVREGNHAARGFYRFLGFREEGRRPRYYAEPVEDAVLMRLGLK